MGSRVAIPFSTLIIVKPHALMRGGTCLKYRQKTCSFGTRPHG